MTIDQIGKLILTVREDYQKLYDKHLLSVKTDGREGLKCFNPEVLEHLVNRTDQEILDDFAKEGMVIEGANKYLAQLKE